MFSKHKTEKKFREVAQPLPRSQREHPLSALYPLVSEEKKEKSADTGAKSRLFTWNFIKMTELESRI